MRSLGRKNGFSQFFQSRSSVLLVLLYGLGKSYPVCVDDDLLYQRVSLISIGIAVSIMYLLVDRTGCFGVSDQPTLTATGFTSSKVLVGYHMGVRLGLGLGAIV